jgi:N-methylhydantoinase A
MLAREVGIGRIIVPMAASVFCALGMLESDLKHDYVRTMKGVLSQLDWETTRSLVDQLETEGKRTLEDEGVPPERIRMERFMDMRYVGQHHEVTVGVPGGWLGPEAAPAIAEAFHQVHERLYTYSEPGNEIEVVNLRVTAIGEVPKTPLASAPETGPDASASFKGRRDAYFVEAGGLVPTALYDGHRLRPGNTVEGPAIIEMVTTSVVLFPKDVARLDRYGNVLVEVAQNG